MEAKQIPIRIFLISALATLAFEFATRWVLQHHSISLVGAVRLIESSLIILIVQLWGPGVSWLGLDMRFWLAGLKRGLLWSAGLAFVSSLIFAGLLLAGINPFPLIKTRMPGSHGDIALYFLVGGVVAPLAEEVFFRGLIYGFLRRWGFPLALVLTTLLFVLAHPMSRGLPVTQLAGGVLFAGAYEMERNLLVPITIHSLGNLGIFTLSVLLQ
jgi:membrane protease YdiL (CAAX protease family)